MHPPSAPGAAFLPPVSTLQLQLHASAPAGQAAGQAHPRRRRAPTRAGAARHRHRAGPHSLCAQMTARTGLRMEPRARQEGGAARMRADTGGGEGCSAAAHPLGWRSAWYDSEKPPRCSSQGSARVRESVACCCGPGAHPCCRPLRSGAGRQGRRAGGPEMQARQGQSSRGWLVLGAAQPRPAAPAGSCGSPAAGRRRRRGRRRRMGPR